LTVTSSCFTGSGDRNVSSHSTISTKIRYGAYTGVGVYTYVHVYI
jgi:hypothetical protein